MHAMHHYVRRSSSLKSRGIPPSISATISAKLHWSIPVYNRTPEKCEEKNKTPSPGHFCICILLIPSWRKYSNPSGHTSTPRPGTCTPPPLPGQSQKTPLPLDTRDIKDPSTSWYFLAVLQLPLQLILLVAHSTAIHPPFRCATRDVLSATHNIHIIINEKSNDSN